MADTGANAMRANARIYRGFTIDHAPPPIPDRSHDWQFAHEDYDGPGDKRCGTGANVEDCKQQIDEILEDQ